MVWCQADFDVGREAVAAVFSFPVGQTVALPAATSIAYYDVMFFRRGSFAVKSVAKNQDLVCVVCMSRLNCQAALGIVWLTALSTYI